MTTHTEIKKMVGKGSTYSPRKLFVAEHGDNLYATNSYWLVPVGAVKPLLDHNNLPSDKPGVYESTSRLAPIPTEPLNLAPIMPADDMPEIKPTQVNGRNAYARLTDGYGALFGEGGATTFNADYLQWIVGNTVAPTFRQAKPTGPVAVYDGEQFLGLLMPVIPRR